MNALLPREFRQAVSIPRSLEDKPKPLYKSIVECQQRRHPDLLAFEAESYVLPLSAVLFLYRRNPDAMREFVLSALGSSGSQEHWENFAAAARDAWNAGDWTLLGLLAYRLDRALDLFSRSKQSAASVDNVTYAILESDDQQSFRHQLVDAFRQAFDLEAGHLDAKSLVLAGAHYLRSLPVSFIIPARLVLVGIHKLPSDAELTLKKDSWPLLEDFWMRHDAAWQQIPSAIDQIDAMPCPWLKYFSRSIRVRKTSTTQPVVRQIENPFFHLARHICQDPPPLTESGDANGSETGKSQPQRSGSLASRVMGAVSQLKNSVMPRTSGRKQGR